MKSTRLASVSSGCAPWLMPVRTVAQHHRNPVPQPAEPKAEPEEDDPEVDCRVELELTNPLTGGS